MSMSFIHLGRGTVYLGKYSGTFSKDLGMEMEKATDYKEPEIGMMFIWIYEAYKDKFSIDWR